MSPRSIHVRLDETATDALAVVRAEASTDSAAVRLALLEAAGRRRRRSALALEAAALAADDADRAEIAEVRELMESLAPADPG